MELLVVVAIIAILMAILLPALSLARDKAREARCIGNLKQIGIALTMWHDNSARGRYPRFDFVSTQLCSKPNLGPWTDALAMRPPVFEYSNIESRRTWFETKSNWETVGDFIKCVDNIEVFMCPADKPHPHRINEGRAKAWNFWRAAAQDGYEHSYGLGVGVDYKGHIESPTGGLVDGYHKDSSSQVLAADGVWNWIQNFRAAYVDDPNSTFNQPDWYCNCIGYFHGNFKRAVLVCRDGSAKSVYYGVKGKGINTRDIFFWGVGESLNIFR